MIFKFFIIAEVKERAKRRFKDMKHLNPNITLEEVENNLSIRDEIDVNREHAPLIKADDAIEIDNSDMTVEQTYAMAMKLVKEKL